MNATLIIAALSALEKSIEVVKRIRAAAQQSNEWTPEQEQEFQAKLETITSQAHWKIEPS